MPKKSNILPDNRDWIAANHTHFSTRELASKFNVSQAYVCKFLKKEGFVKSDEQHKSILLRTHSQEGEVRYSERADRSGVIHKWINVGGTRTRRLSHYLLAKAGRKLNRKYERVIFKNGNPLDCTLENIEVIRTRPEKKKAIEASPKRKAQRAADRKSLRKSDNKKERAFAESLKEKKIRIPDFSGNISVRVNRKTTILIKPGEDPEQAIEKYQRYCNP